MVRLLVMTLWLGGCGAVDKPTPTPDSYDANCASWHQRYVKDHCDRCPECCTNADDECGLCPSKVCRCFKDEYGVWRPLDWLPKGDE